MKTGNAQRSLVAFAILIFAAATLLVAVFLFRNKAAPPNIVLIVSDTLRAKQLPVYGYGEISTPVIDQLAENSILFRNAFVRRANTVPSFSHLFTGSWKASPGLRKMEKTLAEYLAENGMRTVGFVSSRMLWSSEHSEKGLVSNHFDRGFAEYFQDPTLDEFPYHRPNEATTNDVLAWLGKNGREAQPFFLFVHYMDPHSPHEPSYDKEVEKIDTEVGRIVDELKRMSLFDNSLLIFTSDHGESLKEHRSPAGHGWFTYTEQTQIPLLIKFPFSEFSGDVHQVVRNIDVMPTVLSYVGIDYHLEDIDGQSLLPSIIDHTNLGLASFHDANGSRVDPEGSQGLIFEFEGRIFQYINGAFTKERRELYDLLQDPDERLNLAAKREYLPVVERAIRELRTIEERLQKVTQTTDTQALDPKHLDALKSLGYLGGGVPRYRTQGGSVVMVESLGIGTIEYIGIIRKEDWGMTLSPREGRYPLRIFTADNENFLIIANKERDLLAYTREGGFAELSLRGVRDLATGPAGEIYYLHSRNRKIAKLSLDGHELGDSESIDSDTIWSNVEIGPNGRLILLSDTGVYGVDGSDRTKIHKLAGLAFEGVDLRLDNDENIFVAGKSDILKLDSQGRVIFNIEDVFDNEIRSIDVDTEGRIWVLGYDPVVKIYDTEGALIDRFTYFPRLEYYRKRSRKDIPRSEQIFIHKEYIYIVDSWEAILVYRLHSADS